MQPAEKTKAGYLARTRALRDQAVKEGDQAYGAVVVRDGVIVGEGRNYVVLHSDPTAHAELLAVRDAARRLNKRDLSDCDVYSTATPCPMCQGALYWARIRRYHNESTPAEALLRSLPVEPISTFAKLIVGAWRFSMSARLAARRDRARS
jgi:tRNA(Arg) A34 adenosine deaminase TadA